MAENVKRNSRQRMIFIGSAVGAVILVLAVFYFLKSLSVVSTDDAAVEGRIVAISPKVAGYVDKVYVKDNQAVEAGAPLLDLDGRDYEVRREIARSQVVAAKAEEEEARHESRRYHTLAANDEVSQQQLDKTQLRLDTAAARSQEAEANLKQAELNLSYVKIAAPISGRVTKKSVESGMYVQTGQPLLAVIPEERWVVANFKETQITRMRPGQEVDIKVDTYHGKVFKAHVDSIQRGTGARFSLLPPENATGNFVKVVQRIPVKIVFDEPADPDYPLIIGMSVTPEVKIK